MTQPTLPPVGPSQVRLQDIDWGSLSNTLLPYLQSMGLDDATQQKAAEAIHGQAQQAAQQAQGAFQNYQQAASQPAQAGQVPNMWDQLAGGAASIISRNPQYAQQAQQRGADVMSAQGDARAANLKALRDLYEKQALAAEQMGKLDLASQIRSKITSVDKTQEQLTTQAAADRDKVTMQANQAGIGMEQTNAKGDQGMNLERLRQQGRESLLKLKDDASLKFGPDAGARFGANTYTTWNGKKVVDASMFIGKSRDQLMQWASDNDVTPVGGAQFKSLQDIQGARANAEKIVDQITPLLSKTPVERYTTGLRNRFGRIFQTNKELGGYNTWRGSAIRALRAAAGSGGLRLNQAEINLAVQNDIPNEMDTVDTAHQKIQNLVEMLDSAEDPLTTHDWRSLTPGGGLRERATDKPAASPSTSSGDIEFVRGPDGKLVRK